jgi:glycosyltransferase involved in cell wall biosynthesis
MDSPQLSIITPVLNGERYIAACIQNVMAQSIQTIEHIIVDGGSTDGTLRIVSDFRSRCPHIRFIPGPDDGQSEAMNKGIRAAKAPIISFLNYDDFYEDGAFEEALSILANCPQPSFVTGNTRVIDSDGRTIRWNRPHDLRIESMVLGWRYTTTPQNPSAYFYHKALHDWVGYYDTDLHYDMDNFFIFSCAAAGIPMIYVDRHWGNFRSQPGGKTFDDQQAGTQQVRLAALYNSFISRFTWKQRFKMHAIRISKEPKRAAWLLANALGLR